MRRWVNSKSALFQAMIWCCISTVHGWYLPTLCLQMLSHRLVPEHQKAQRWHPHRFIFTCVFTNIFANILTSDNKNGCQGLRLIKTYFMFVTDLRLLHHMHVRFQWIFPPSISPPATQCMSSINIRGTFYYHGLSLIPAWISNHMTSKVCDEITYLFPNLGMDK